MTRASVRSDEYRRGGARPVLVLLLLVAAAAALLLWVRGRDSAPDFTLGGPLFGFDADEIEGLILTRSGRQYRFDRHAGDVWSLTGAGSDFVDTGAMAALVRDLLAAAGGPVLPGTEPEDRRYDFNGPAAVRLTVLAGGGRSTSLAIGVVNPVTGNHYASGAGRDACFPVATELRMRLAELPAKVQLRRLLPLESAAMVDTVTVWRGDRSVVLARQQGRWWLRVSVDELARLRGTAGVYHRTYDDRIRRDRGGTWLLAERSRVTGLIHQASTVIVRQIMPREETPALTDRWNLDPPWRRVVLVGTGINADPTVPADELSLDFGPALAADSVPVLRRGNVLLTDFSAAAALEMTATDFIHTGALAVDIMSASGFVLEREGRRLLEGVRRPEENPIGDGRNAWHDADAPTGEAGAPPPDRLDYTRELVVDLDRLPIVRVLPPGDDPEALLAEERLRIVVTRDTPTGSREEVFFMGYLDAARLGDTPVDDRPDPGAAALWVPDTGQLLQVPDHVIVTARNLERARAAEGTR